jgi:transcriptional regulator with XRE-family HTH domain
LHRFAGLLTRPLEAPEIMAIKQLLGKRIRKVRIERGFSQEELAEKAGLHYTYVGAVERGEKNCTITVLERIALGLNIPLAELIEFSGSTDKTDETKQMIIDEITNSPAEVVKLVSDVLKDLRPLKQKQVTRTAKRSSKKKIEDTE